METQQKQNTKENQNKNNTKETKYKEIKEKQNDQPEKARARSDRNTAEEGGDGRMTRWGRVKDLPQVEGYETPKAGRPK